MLSEPLELLPLYPMGQILMFSESLFDKYPHYPRIYRLMYICICIAVLFNSMKHKR